MPLNIKAKATPATAPKADDDKPTPHPDPKPQPQPHPDPMPEPHPDPMPEPHPDPQPKQPTAKATSTLGL